MMTIKDMEMPSCCALCEIFEGACKYTDFGDYQTKRNPSCPLVEIVTCKDCKYFERLTCLGGQCVSPTKTYINETTNDFYCADAERRE